MKLAFKIFTCLFLIASFAMFLPPRSRTDAAEYVNIDSWTELQGIGTADGYPAGGMYQLSRSLTAADPDYAAIVGGEAGFTPIANFTGRFSGGGFEIQGLVINLPDSDNVGLFGSATAARFANVTFTNAEITGNDDVGVLLGSGSGVFVNGGHSSGVVAAVGTGYTYSVGGLIGNISSTSTIMRSSSSVTVSSNASGVMMGGLVGSSVDSTINTSYSTGDVSGNSAVGGLVGDAMRVTIADCYSWSDVAGNNEAGGLVGALETEVPASIYRSYSTGSVTTSGEDYQAIGGLVGMVYSDDVNDSFSTGQVTASGTFDTYAGMIGLFGNSELNILVNVHWYNGFDYPEGFGCYVRSGIPGNEICTGHDNLTDFKGEAIKTMMPTWVFDGDVPVWKTVVNGYPILAWQPDVPQEPPADTTPPAYQEFTGSNSGINVTEGQSITTNPYIIKVLPTDDTAIQKVEFYVDDNLLCAATTADTEGIYSCAWDTSRYHSVVKTIAFDTSNNTTQLTRTTVVDPSLYSTATVPTMTELPKTGRSIR